MTTKRFAAQSLLSGALVEVLADRPWRRGDTAAQEEEAAMLESVAERLREGAEERRGMTAEAESEER